MRSDVIVSLTSWKDRINTVSKTIFSIYSQCDCKIVLTLSTEEFPNKEKDLPEELLNMVNEGFLEFLWVKENEKCFKKVLYTLDKYRDIPVVSADDDCIYTENYVKILFDKWLTDKNAMWTYVRDTNIGRYQFGHGPACIYPPYCFGENGLKFIKNTNILNTWHDDIYYGVLAKKMGIEVKQAIEDNKHRPYYFHDEVGALSKGKTVNGILAIRICEQNIILNQNRNLCVLGCLKTEYGLNVKQEMLTYLNNDYKIICVEQEPPGELFEYPAIQMAINLAIEKNEPVLYIHTKGAAYHDNQGHHKYQGMIRSIWYNEFIKNKSNYFKYNLNENVVVTPFTGNKKVTWFNSFVIYPEAAKELLKTFHLDKERYYYECMFEHTSTNVIGVIRNDLNDVNTVLSYLNLIYEYNKK